MGSTITEARPIRLHNLDVLAVLAGQKTQHREVVTWNDPDPGLNLGFSGLRIGHYCTDVSASGFVLYGQDGTGTWNQRTKPTFCPLGDVGDLLWVQEDHWRDKREPGVVIYDATPEWGKYQHEQEPTRSTFVDGTFPTREESRAAMLPKFWGKAQSIIMPRWAARITIRIASVRVERLRSISYTDCVAEGAPPVPCYDDSPDPTTLLSAIREQFAMRWNEINGETAWKRNDWVWVVGFDREIMT